MTVKELTEKLKEFDENARVYLADIDCLSYDISITLDKDNEVAIEMGF